MSNPKNTERPTPHSSMLNAQRITLSATPHNGAGEFALQIYAAAMRSVRADSLMSSALHLDCDTFEVRGDR